MHLVFHDLSMFHVLQGYCYSYLTTSSQKPIKILRMTSILFVLKALVDYGALDVLVTLIKRKEVPFRVNGVWGLMVSKKLACTP